MCPKRAVHLGEHADKKTKTKVETKSVKCLKHRVPLKTAFSVSRHILKGAESDAANLTQGVVSNL